ncbi:hypothetical protein HBI56_181120 [Parastagonospora nodorum]|uniref:Epoxide hydrolase N-terminal domain-containing protein n=1 Tax=Phaeosphaeria nodorum (strain SN15 / ATCC MYA-4574 / FGSC 10173) TaxID=321614 RepID=A0A7U2FDI5_PHANO|nr:hypothetical protein HBH56_186500 [Parastagonospora nodorum]QRD01015.1 hypothetical protein JI435_153850 [Parastagonospora nodorum SN15]KAH3925262.1 hypothetical protein HBH54_182060 [Parastagonospora nodorum]KAH3958263.1 hypothetical protein HBH51_212810 [Parastagonospora nodorum]KAH3962104.1 hypothetical protein HBH52_227060 [Parastagonospora nodorum]
MPSPQAPPDGLGELGADDLDRLGSTKEWQATAMAYAQVHATRPQTIGYSLADSPVGLLAWMFEKLHTWTDGYSWTQDEILTWVSIYYFSKPGPAAAQHIYFENAHRQPPAFEQAAKYIDVKLGVSLFPKEIVLLPLSWNKTLGPVVFERRHEKGGHFAAWECPEALATDLQDMFGTCGGAYKCIEGASGFA